MEGNRMPGQRAEGQQQKTHCPWVYTQPHPLPRPGPGPFLCSECPHPCGHFSRFPSFIETNHPHLHLKHKKMQLKRHLCCAVTGGLIGWIMWNLGEICKQSAALRPDDCNVIDYILTVMRLSWEGLLINLWRCGRPKADHGHLCVITAHM